jgi:ceramide glucosyltransferase
VHIDGTFLPGVLLARALGRRDCLGATMALRRATLDRIGGFAALGGHLVDDALLGVRVAALGFRIGLATFVPATTVAETKLTALLSHELRWAVAVRSITPAGAALSLLQLPTV